MLSRQLLVGQNLTVFCILLWREQGRERKGGVREGEAEGGSFAEGERRVRVEKLEYGAPA